MKEIDVKELAARLAGQADKVCRHLLPNGREIRGKWVTGDVNDSPGKSLSVTLSGALAGKFKDYGAPEYRGDLVELWQQAKGTDKKEAIRQVKDWLGIRDDFVVSPSRKTYAKPPEKSAAASSPDSWWIKWMSSERGIGREVVEHFRIGASPKYRTVFFPCHAPDGELINRSYRTVPDDGSKKKVWQDEGCGPCLFGWHGLREEAWRERMVIITEGQIDAMTWHQWGFPALSIPNGTGTTWIEYEWENLAPFERIYLHFDGDNAGKNNMKEVVTRLGKERCYLVSSPKKDANDCLMAGYGAGDARLWLDSAKSPFSDVLATGTQMADEFLDSLLLRPQPFTLPYFNVSWENDLGLYFRPGEVTVWTGSSHHGKSTFLNSLALSAMESGLSIMIASLEMPPLKTMQRMARVALSLGKSSLSQDSGRSFLMKYGDLIVMSKAVGSITADTFFSKAMFALRRHGVSHVFLDSLMRVEGLEEDYPKQGDFMNRLQSFAKETGVHIHLVAHPKKISPADRPGMMDVKGSSLIPNNADNVVAIWRNAEKTDAVLAMRDKAILDSMHDAEIIVTKQRESGWQGTFLLKFDPSTLQFSKFTPPPPANIHHPKP